MKTLASFIFALLVGTACMTSALAAGANTLRIGLNNWSENVAVSNMWKILLEERGYDIELVKASKVLVYSGIASDSLDMGLEVWMPKTDKQYYERFKDKIVLQDAWYYGTGLGLVVPSYVDIDSIPELAEHTKQFEKNGQPTIVGIDPGSALMGLTGKAIDKYDLNINLMSASGPAMMAALDRAYKRENPIVVTLWNPHWAFAEYDLKYLDDPKGVYGDGENIHWMSSPELEDTHPELVTWLNAWKMDDQQLGSLMAVINRLGDPAEGARQWISEHQELVNSWF